MQLRSRTGAVGNTIGQAQALKSESQNTRKSPSTTQDVLVSFDDIPHWYQDNEFIRHGYRPESSSATSCFASWLYYHNESFNIFSHFVPALAFLSVQTYVLSTLARDYPNAVTGDYVIFASFLLAAAFTLTLSALYHTLLNHSAPISLMWLKLDYFGILTLILLSFVSGVYVFFMCSPFLQKVYWFMILSFGMATSILVLHPNLQGSEYRDLRTKAFVMTGLTGMIPICHGLLDHGWHHMWTASGMPFYLMEGAIYILGALLYTLRLPESQWPGKFDRLGCSHNIFHVLVVIATLAHLMGLRRAYHWNYHNSGCRER